MNKRIEKNNWYEKDSFIPFYDSLSPQRARLCVYFNLSLESKEIFPLPRRVLSVQTRVCICHTCFIYRILLYLYLFPPILRQKFHVTKTLFTIEIIPNDLFLGNWESSVVLLWEEKKECKKKCGGKRLR